jgi:hypothetical protein
MHSVKLINPLDDPRWDAFVSEHPDGWVTHLSTWKHILETSFNHMRGYYFVYVNNNNNAIEAGLPVFYVRSWLTGNRLVSIPFATLSCPLISSHEQIPLLWKSVRDLARTLSTKYVEVRTIDPQLLESLNLLRKTVLYKSHFLSLDSSPKQLEKRFHKMTRRNIRKALGADLAIRESNGEEDLKGFYRLYGLNRKRKGLPLQPYRFIKCLYDSFARSGKAQLLLVEYRDRPVASGIFFKFQNRFSNEFDAWDYQYNHLRPNYFLYWKALEIAHSENYRIFDFGRTSISNEGLMGFKGRWATKPVDLPHFYFPADFKISSTQTDKSWKYKLVQDICKHANGTVHSLVSNFCYRHLG